MIINKTATLFVATKKIPELTITPTVCLSIFQSYPIDIDRLYLMSIWVSGMFLKFCVKWARLVTVLFVTTSTRTPVVT
jgi:hypothetical protein